MRFAEAENLARSVHNDRPGKGAGTPERNQPLSDEVHSVPSPPRRLALARADSGNVRESRMTLYPEIAKFQIVKRNTMVALRVVYSKHYMWRVPSFMFHKGRLAMPWIRRG